MCSGLLELSNLLLGELLLSCACINVESCCVNICFIVSPTVSGWGWNLITLMARMMALLMVLGTSSVDQSMACSYRTQKLKGKDKAVFCHVSCTILFLNIPFPFQAHRFSAVGFQVLC